MTSFLLRIRGSRQGCRHWPVMGSRFGFLEHVLAVEEEDIFEGIVVRVGQGGWLDRRIQHDLSRGHRSRARHLEALRPQELRFVEADKIAAITVGYIRCDLSLAEVGMLEPPSGARAVQAAGPGGLRCIR